MTAPLPEYTVVARTSGANAAFKDGTVTPQTFVPQFVEVDPLIAAFRRMVRERAYDISELAITTYLVAKSFGKRFTALPIPLVRAFHHGAILINTKAGIAHPKDLEGKRVGVNRGYTVTTGVWARGILAREYGVDLDRITWVLSGDEHVAEYRPPANVVPVEPGQDVAQMLVSGELAGAIGVTVDHPDVRPLIPHALEAGLSALRARGEYPINHVVVVRDELLEAHPELARDVYDVFERAKERYVERLRAGAIEQPDAMDRMHLRVMEIVGDPLPYGLEANRAALETLIGDAVAQKIIPAAVPVESLFAPVAGVRA